MRAFMLAGSLSAVVLLAACSEGPPPVTSDLESDLALVSSQRFELASASSGDHGDAIVSEIEVPAMAAPAPARRARTRTPPADALLESTEGIAAESEVASETAETATEMIAPTIAVAAATVDEQPAPVGTPAPRPRPVETDYPATGSGGRVGSDGPGPGRSGPVIVVIRGGRGSGIDPCPRHGGSGPMIPGNGGIGVQIGGIGGGVFINDRVPIRGGGTFPRR